MELRHGTLFTTERHYCWNGNSLKQVWLRPPHSKTRPPSAKAIALVHEENVEEQAQLINNDCSVSRRAFFY